MRGTKQIAKWMTGAALFGALALAVPQQARAQVSFGIAVGAYPAYGYAQPYFHNEYERQRWFEHEQRERWEAERAAEFRREQWERDRYRDREWHDRDGYRGNNWHGERY